MSCAAGAGVKNCLSRAFCGPLSIGLDTIELSQGQIPESFLRGCGVSDRLIEYIPSLTTRPIDYYSCFISYSSHDEGLAQRLHDDLQPAGVRCWYAPEDLKIGESILGGIDHGIRLHDKQLLLSESSVQSTWVETEVNLALARERTERRRVLFPVRIDDAVFTSGAAWAGVLRADYLTGDFRQWHDYATYQAVFARLLRDLRAEGAPRSSCPRARRRARIAGRRGWGVWRMRSMSRGCGRGWRGGISGGERIRR